MDKPAQGPARIAIMKRASNIRKRLAMTTLVDGHAHMIVGLQASPDSLAEVRAGSTSFVDDHSHNWIMDDAGNISIAPADGHSHEIAVFITKSDAVNEDILAEGILASLAPDEQKASITKAADDVGNESEDTTMSKQEGDEPQAITQDQLDEVVKRAEGAELIVKLSPEQRAHYETLKGDEQDTFLKSEDKDSILSNLVDADPVVHTDLDGNEIRKSEGATVLRLAKSNDKLRKEAAAGQALVKRSGFEKRAGDELSHVTGDDSAKADLLEAVDSLPIEKREAVLTILKSKDAGMAKAFQTVGTSGGDSDGLSAGDRMDILAKKHREDNPNLSPEAAYVAALDTPEGRELQDQLVG